MNITERTILENVAKLSESQQEQVMHYTQVLVQNRDRVTDGESIIAVIQNLAFDPLEVERMAEAIEMYCEQIDADAYLPPDDLSI